MMRWKITTAGVLLSSLIMSLSNPTPLCAQSQHMLLLNAGFAPGTHIVKSEFEGTDISSFHLGTYVGSNFLISIDDHNRLSVGLNYVQKGYYYREKSEFNLSFDDFDVDLDLSLSYDFRFRLKLHYLHLPLTWYYYPSPSKKETNLYFLAGTHMDILTGANVKAYFGIDDIIKFKISTSDISDIGPVRKTEWGIHFGMGLSKPVGKYRLFLESRYNQALTPWLELKPFDEKWYNTYFIFAGGISFPL